MDDETRDFILSLCARILAAHEVLARRAERRLVVVSEVDYCPVCDV